MGSDTACDQLARRHDLASVASRLKDACERGTGSACTWLARHDEREGRTDVVSLLDRACALGHARGCAGRAAGMSDSTESMADPGGVRAWRRACEGGDGAHCWSLGLAVEAETIEIEAPVCPFEPWVLGCRAGDPSSCFAASREASEDGTLRPTSAALLSAACPNDSRPETPAHWDACLERAGMLERGEAGEADPDQAARLYERVCDMKIRAGCREAGRMARKRDEDGSGERAVALYGKACRLGDTGACMRAAELAGEEGHAWHERACRWFRFQPACARLDGR